MKPTFPLVIAALFMLTACSGRSGSYDSELTRKQIEIVKRNDLNYMMLHPTTDDSYNGTVREAAFQMIKGMQAEQAIAVFETDGATCQNRTCIWAYRDRETWAEVTFGIRMPGPRRTFDRFRRVTVEADVVVSVSDVTVEHWSEIESTP